MFAISNISSSYKTIPLRSNLKSDHQTSLPIDTSNKTKPANNIVPFKKGEKLSYYAGQSGQDKRFVETQGLWGAEINGELSNVVVGPREAIKYEEEIIDKLNLADDNYNTAHESQTLGNIPFDGTTLNYNTPDIVGESGVIPPGEEYSETKLFNPPADDDAQVPSYQQKQPESITKADAHDKSASPSIELNMNILAPLFKDPKGGTTGQLTQDKIQAMIAKAEGQSISADDENIIAQLKILQQNFADIAQMDDNQPQDSIDMQRVRAYANSIAKA